MTAGVDVGEIMPRTSDVDCDVVNHQSTCKYVNVLRVAPDGKRTSTLNHREPDQSYGSDNTIKSSVISTNTADL